ncbi:hypothetical protein PENSPDRAFT_660467 [Peniophora sp. CONT]|nr:hypothetical protein PENSPDRAFT_660467 [Peniophora sp. CONT]
MCTFCKTHRLECKHTHGVREEKLEPATEDMESLESLVKSMALWIRQRHPDIELTEEFDMPRSIAKWLRMQRNRVDTTHPVQRLPGELARINLADDQGGDEDDLSDEGNGGDKISDLQTRFQSMTVIEQFMGKGSVMGRSNGLTLIKHALELKQNQRSDDDRIIPSRREDLWSAKQFLWLNSSHEARIFDLPPGDLMQTLVDIFFVSHAPVLPLFHQPTFRKNMNMGLHFREPAFAAVVLLVCAITSRFVDDTRVLPSNSWYSAGYQWYLQAKNYYTPSKSAPSLHDIQMCTLMCGTAIRLAMDVGAHRRRAYQKVPTVEDELWKRAFCYDLELPLDVDDEYWETPDPAQAFKQPSQKPSRVSFLIALIKLMKISGIAMRTIFSANPRANILLEALGKGWEQKIVTALDSALNEWMSRLPEHLRWDPRPTDPTFLFQSGVLHTEYNQIQIVVHRAYIPTPRKPPQTTFPSLAICTNAARSCCQIVSYCRKNVPLLSGNFNAFQKAAFQPATVLIFAIWNARRNGFQIDISKDMQYIWECMDILRAAEHRFIVAGKLWDILYELVTIGDLPLSPAPTPPESSRSTNLVADNLLQAGPSNLARAVPTYQHQELPLPIPNLGIGRLPHAGFSTDTGTIEINTRIRSTWFAGIAECSGHGRHNGCIRVWKFWY